MDRNSIDWSGVFPAMTTPFDDDGRIDEKGLAASLDRLVGAGADGFVVTGCTGEFWALNQDERARCCEVAVEAVAGRATLIVELLCDGSCA